MDKSTKTFTYLLILFFGLFALSLWGYISLQEYLHPNPVKLLSRMERQDSKAAQQIIDSYAEGLELIAAATEYMASNDSYRYHLRSAVSTNMEVYQKMPQELAEAVRQMERDFPSCSKALELRPGQIGIRLTDDGGGFSFLCYPGGELISHSVIDDEQGTRCLDMGGGWELQMYYAPKG